MPAAEAATPRFSIIVPTRNRPATLRRALSSIGAQTFTDYEVIVVDDGSQDMHLGEARALCAEMGERFRLLERGGPPARQGPNAARNAGLAEVRAAYVAFLDDDDFWCDAGHLEAANRCLLEKPQTDLFLANQVAKRGNEVIVDCWLPRAEQVKFKRPKLGEQDCYELKPRDLLYPAGIGFGHVNMYITRRDLIRRVDGFWELAPYEGDLGFFLRLMDHVDRIVYRAATVAVNTVRESSLHGGVSSLLPEDKLLLRSMSVQHAALHCSRTEVRRYIRLLLGGVHKTFAKQAFQSRQFLRAASQARRAVAVDPSVRWMLIAFGLHLLAVPAAVGRRGA